MKKWNIPELEVLNLTVTAAAQNFGKECDNVQYEANVNVGNQTITTKMWGTLS